MGYTQTPINRWRVPDKYEYVNKGYYHDQVLGGDAELFTVMRFANMTELTSKLVGASSPQPGMVAFIVADGAFYGYTVGPPPGWKRIYPVELRIYTGTAVPAASTGAVGDIYIQY